MGQVEHIIQLIGKLRPTPIEEYEEITEHLPSFSIVMRRDTSTASPLADVQLAPDAAIHRLEEEIAPLLTAIGFTEHQTIRLEVDRIEFSENATGRATVTASAALSALVAHDGALSADETKRRARWVAEDPTYRDLLSLHSEASRASNPRPAAFKMVERLEEQFGNRPKACAALGLTNGQLKPIVADQSKYSDDRHAKYPVGIEVPPLDPTTRAQVIAAINRIVSLYEDHMFLSDIGEEP